MMWLSVLHRYGTGCIFTTRIERQHVARLIESSDLYIKGKLPLSENLGKYFIKIGKISAKLHKIGKIKAIFGMGMTPI